MRPITRIEKFLDGIINGTEVPTPLYRTETILNDIKNGVVTALTPITREEAFLAKISGANVPTPTPRTRIELFLAKKAGLDVTVPNPIYRVEHWLNDWIVPSDPLNTFTGVIARFFCREAKPIVKLEADFTPIQDLNGYDAPWPPGGGKNLFDADTGSNGYIDNSGSVVARTYQFASDYIAVTAGNAYTISAASRMANIGIAYFDSNKAIILPRVDNASRQTLTITPATGVAYVRFWFYKNQSTDLNPTNVKETYKVQFEAGSSATTYAPYSNICPISGHTGCDIFDKAEYDAGATPTVTISFGQTVYSGTLTINEDGTGTVTATDTGSPQLLWVRGSANNAGTGRIFYAYYTRAETNVSTITMTNGALKTVTRPSAWEAQEENSISFGATNVLIVTDNVDTTLADLPTWLSNKGLQLIGTLKTPVTVTISGEQLVTLVGTNTIWVNDATGDITVQAYGTPIS